MPLIVYQKSSTNSRPRNNLDYDQSVEQISGILAFAAEVDATEGELRELLTESGFDGESADVDDCGESGFKVRVWGPDDMTISL